MVYAEQGDLDLESDLREHFQQEAVRDLEAFDRRLRAIEERLGIVSEGRDRSGRPVLLAAEGDQEDPQELTVEEVAGMPLASWDGGPSVVTEGVANGFDLFGGRPDADRLLAEVFQTRSGVSVRDAVRDRLGTLLDERRQTEPVSADDNVVQPHELAGMPLARGF